MTAANSMTLYAKYQEIRSREGKKREIEDRINNQIRDRQKKEIFVELEAEGIPEKRVETNGYSFRFDLNGMWINFVVQTERVCGEMYRQPQNLEECILVANGDFLLSQGELKNEFRREFLYHDFCVGINGDLASAVGEIIAMAENPLAPFNESAANDDKSQGSAR